MLRGYYMTFEDWIKRRRQPRYDAICCGVDSIPTMVAVAEYGLRMKMPVIYTNVSEDGEACRIFIQRPSKKAPCFVCYMPEAINHLTQSDQPASQCRLSLTSCRWLLVLVHEPRLVSFWEFLSATITAATSHSPVLDFNKIVVKRPDCQLCGRLS